MAHEDMNALDDKVPCEPQAYSMIIGTDGKDTGYATKVNEVMDLAWMKTHVFQKKNWNGQGSMEQYQTVIERRQPKLTEKGKPYRLAERRKERNKLKRDMQSRIANIETLMGLDKNLELVSEESVKLHSQMFQTIWESS